MSLWSRLERRLSDLAGDLILDEHREQLVQARALLDAGNPAAAVEILQALIARRPDHGQALVLLAAAHLQAGDPERALEVSAAALAQRGDDPAALLVQGQALLELVRPDDAAAPLERAAREAGGDRAVLADAYAALGEAWRQRGDLDKAVRELRKAAAEAPGDAEIRAALGEAMLLDGGHPADDVARQLERALEAGAAPPVVAQLALGSLALGRGLPDEASVRFAAAAARLADPHTPLQRRRRLDALIGLGDAALAQRDAVTAHQRFFEALTLEPRHAALHARIGDAHRAARNPAVALASYQRALALGAGGDVLRAALAAATDAGDAAAQIQLANDLLAVEPDSPAALVARGRGTLAAGDPTMARALLRGPAEAGDPDARVALAEVALTQGELRAAQRELRAVLTLAPRHAGARARLAETYRQAAAIPTGPTELPALAAALERVLAGRPELAARVGDVARAVAELDQPLLVTVMGEFSSGKSSFVNALVGAEVAPTGITPTTATINVVRYGAERGGRVIYRDDRADGAVEALGWDALLTRLRGLTDAEARAIDHVEILVPLPQLERIHIVDTPGLNSIQPEHEATARGFIARADAVVWVFTAGQGGKASERAALQTIRDDGRRVLGVLNKADQLSASDLAEVTAFVTATLGELVEVVVPASARAALAHQLGGDASDGNWPAVTAALEQRFFAQARQLKRDAATRRLRAIIRDALAAAEVHHAAARDGAAAAQAAASTLASERAGFAARVLVPERTALAAGLTELYRTAAREVLELVRPRRAPFGAHSATAADRDYLRELLGHGGDRLLDAGRARVATALGEVWRKADAAARDIGAATGVDVAGDVARFAEAQAELALTRSFDRARAYQRGVLDGGAIDTFFRSDLARLELSEDAVFHALYRGAPDLDRELGEPLAVACGTAIQAVHARLEHWAAVADVRAWELAVSAQDLLDDVAAQLA
jgi:tetratricopeptide (TPR) repeat protein